MTMLLARPAVVGCLMLCLACGRDVSAPCPKPWFELEPAAAETLTVGSQGTFWIPPAVSLKGRRFEWRSMRVAVATVPADANPQLAPISAIGSGETTILAIDLNSPENCPDIWAGTVVVR
jgi:hypothetical protein